MIALTLLALAASAATGDGPSHWAFLPPQRPAVPLIRARGASGRGASGRGASGRGASGRVANPIDAFVFAPRPAGRQPAPPADRTPRPELGAKATLLRRATFDLIGLPPTPDEVDALVNDTSPRAWEKVIDRLLASPRYGERWGRHWLDVAGYADSEGVLEEDRLRTNAWRYRDYVIRAFNDDKPYDRFVREQLAGDELVDWRDARAMTREVVDPLIATGFLRTAVDATRDDFAPRDFAEYQWRMFFDTQHIVTSALLGLTMNCAQCHDHKFEPITQKDYYRFQAFFAGAIRPSGPLLPSYRREIVMATKDQQETAKENNAKVEAALKEIAAQQAALVSEFKAKHTQGANATDAELRQTFPDYARRADELARGKQAAESRRVTLPTIRALYDLDAKPPATRLLKRGDPLHPGEDLASAIPAVLSHCRLQLSPPTEGATTSGRRRVLAEWLTRPDHPLTARVMVNRIWAHHFGEGLVPTVANFGVSGAAPTNQPLLDWLATEFVRRGWSVKAIHRLIMTSAAYRQSAECRGLSSRPFGSAEKQPPGQKLSAPEGSCRQHSSLRTRRLEAEAIRDSILLVAGTLNTSMFGEAVMTEAKPTGEVVPVGDNNGGRRTIYQLVRRSRPQSLLNAFDAPVMETNCTRRASTTTATQTLAVLNGEFVTAQAGHFARRVLRERPIVGDDHTASVEHAFRLAWSRQPTKSELLAALKFVTSHARRYEPAQLPEQRLRVYTDFCHALLSANEFVYVD